MSFTYSYYSYSTNNISGKCTEFDNRLNVNFQLIAVSTAPVTYDSGNYIFTFGAELSNNEFDIVNNLVRIIANERQLDTVYPNPRTFPIVNNRAPTVFNDYLNGYNVGDIAINPTSNLIYICVDNTNGAARWNLLSGKYELYFNSAGNLLSGSYLGDGSQYSTRTHGERLINNSGYLRNLYCDVETAPGVGNSWTFTVYVGATPTALSVTISGTATTGSNTSNTLTVDAFDKISLRVTSTGSPAPASGLATISFMN